MRGHFGEWLQGTVEGRVVLVTVPAPLEARVERLGDGPLEAPGLPDPAAFLAALGLPARGRYRLSLDMPPGGGAGASTASLLALAEAAGARAAPAALAAACRAAEGAVDPLMLPEPDACLWAPREARAIRALPAPPPACIVGGFWGPAARTDPADDAFPEVSDLLPLWEGAVRTGDLATCAAVACTSAARTTAMRGPDGDPTPDVAMRLGALGWLRAHTGSARALVFAPRAVPEGAEAMLREAGYAGTVRFETGPRRRTAA